jgi:DNA-binding response OmpR family regulator/predicted  nucleic acid-binding Zn-ribbon protein
MAKTILLIESDAAFAREASSALEGRGFAVRVSADGKEGLDVARDLLPDAIVLCVELPRMSGYSVCNKLKKDDTLKSIPLVIVSAEATPETFEQHRKLKTRAEDYLIKPFSPETLVERVGALVGFPAHAPGEEEVVTLADVELDQAAREIHASAGPPDEDDDLRLLDDAFDSIARIDEPAEVPALEFSEAAPPEPMEAAGEAVASPADGRGTGDGASELASLAEEPRVVEDPVATDILRPAAEEPPEPAPPEIRPANVDILRAAGIPLFEPEPAEEPRDASPDEAPAGRDLDDQSQELAEVRRTLEERDAELQALREELSRALGTAEQATQEGSTRESELRASRARLEAVQGSVKRLESDLKASREEARRAQERAAAMEKDLSALRQRLEETEQVASQRGSEIAEALARAESLERALDEARVEVTVIRNEAGALRGEADRRTSDLRRRVLELESQTARHEERVVKAYQKIKSDEKLKEKTRKALAIALQLLDERLPVEGSSDPAGGPERPAS